LQHNNNLINHDQSSKNASDQAVQEQPQAVPVPAESSRSSPNLQTETSNKANQQKKNVSCKSI